tara:strand:+ start:7955 stop:8347 length:393 start_codon:yes stop_codon:yes gene_type:complete
MGNSNSINRVNFERVKNIIQNDDYIIINTLSNNKQDILIEKTLSIVQEETTLNILLKNNKQKKILIYGENSCDISLVKKYNQLNKLGFTNLFIYIGGLFEWLLLNEIYGNQEFPIINKNNDIIIDILKFK